MTINKGFYNRIHKVRFELNKETDRGCVLLGVSFLESELENLIKSYLISDNKIIPKVFNGQGGLSTFSSKIDFAFLLGLISKEAHNDFNTIRKVRNIFAHSYESINFDTDQIKDLSNNLKNHYRKEDDITRKKFISTVYGLLSEIFVQSNKVTKRKELLFDEEKKKLIVAETIDFRSEMEEYIAKLNEEYKDSPNKKELINSKLAVYFAQIQKTQGILFELIDKNSG